MAGDAAAGAAGADSSANDSGDAQTDAGADANDAASDAPVDAAPDVPCAQNPEVCNGLDDNCNGVVDENDPGGGDPCTLPNKQGICAEGTMHCLNGILACAQDNQPTQETCNGLDDNCDGQVDEGNPGGNQACNTGKQGVCAAGTTQCVNGNIECQQNIQPSAEVCNGLDDDCNGQVDDGFAGAGDPCKVPGQPQNSPCADGQTTCSINGQSSCTQTVFPTSETCDGLDDNCDGTVDNGLDGHDCDTGLPGVCQPGKTSCTNATLTCVPNIQPNSQQEICDGLDNNCDGTIDDVSNINLECGTKNSGAKSVASWQCTAGYCAVATCISTHRDCDGLPGNGCEVDTSLDATNCGACGNVCDSTNGSPYCVSSTCKIACDTGYGDCDNNVNNGCETNTNTDTSNCGTCGNTCSGANGSTSCTNGSCVPVCNSGYGDCDGNPNNGCETNLNTSTNNCNACGTPCVNPNGTTSCVSGSCVPVCSSGTMDCDGNTRNGCETITANDINNCGGCGVKCVNANGVTSCVNGACVPVCLAGTADCDGNPNNGCETNINTNVNNCGVCGNACTNANGTTACVGGVCSPSCANGYASCDGNPNNGCETNLGNSTNNCGTCGNQCTNVNGSTSCVSGTCSPSCSSGYGDCDSNPDNGCETNKNTSTNNCGACGNQCTNANGTTSCVGGTCSPSCSSGYKDCDSNPDNGCETHTATDVNNCGSCNNVCTNPNGTVSCSGGICQLGCSSGYADCDGNSGNGCETHTATDASNCGGCNIQCVNPNGTTSCVSSTCVPVCSGGYGNCDGNGVNGCETNLATSTNHCGSCGTACTNLNGTTSCISGACSPSCNSGWGDCDGNLNNGCETNLNTTTNHCGACGTACTNSNGSTSCSSGTCSPSCSSGSGDCDGNPNNGCETNLNSSTANCGACNYQCTNQHGSTSCVGSICSPSCNSGYASCDGNLKNGCETNTTNDSQNCGGCGNSCTNPLPAHTASAACQSSSCAVTGCSSGYYNQNGSYADGCECQADAIPNSCSSAYNLGTIAVNGTKTQTGNIVPTSDVDWYKVTFTIGPSCSFNPAITLVTNGAPIAMQIVKSCGGAGISCTQEGGASDAAAGFTSWAFNYSNTCGEKAAIDPTPDNGNFINTAQIPNPVTVYIKVFPTGSSTTCMPYSLQVAN